MALNRRGNAAVLVAILLGAVGCSGESPKPDGGRVEFSCSRLAAQLAQDNTAYARLTGEPQGTQGCALVIGGAQAAIVVSIANSVPRDIYISSMKGNAGLQQQDIAGATLLRRANFSYVQVILSDGRVFSMTPLLPTEDAKASLVAAISARLAQLGGDG